MNHVETKWRRAEHSSGETETTGNQEQRDATEKQGVVMQWKGEESLSLEWNRIEPKRIGKARTRKGRDATER